MTLEQKKLENTPNWKQTFDSAQPSLNERHLIVGKKKKQDLTIIKGIGWTNRKKLSMAGLDTIEKISNASIRVLSAIEGIGQTIAKKIKENARTHLKMINLENFS